MPRRTRPAFDPAPFLARSRLFADVRPETRAELARAARRLAVSRGELVYGPARAPEGAYIVAGGCVSLLVQDRRGRDNAVEICNPGDSFGEDCLLGDASALTARAVGAGLLVLVPRAALLHAMERDAGLARALLHSVSRKLARAANQIGGQAARSGQQRLIGYLLQQLDGRPSGDNGPALLTLAVPKRVVASLLGLSKETFSRLLSLLAGRGLIEVKGRTIRVPDPDALAALCHEGLGCTGCAGCPRGERWVA